MKFFFLLFISVLFLACSSDEVTKRAIAYNDAIVTEQNNIVARIVDMSNALSNPNLSEMYRIKIIDQCDKSIGLVSKMESFEGDLAMRDAALDLFRFYREIAANDFKVILEIYALPELGESDYRRLYELEEEISMREELFDLGLKKAQKGFSDKYNLTLQRNEQQDLVEGN